MATMAVEKTVVIANTPDLEAFVKDATWKDVLFELVKKNELDPWDIDITKLVSEYLETIRQMQLLDLRVPANIMLAAAILVRLKSDLLSFETQQEEPEPPMERPVLYSDVLLPRIRIPPKRKITLSELIAALDEAIKIKEKREERFSKEEIQFPLSFSPLDIESEANELLELLKKNVDTEKMVLFSRLIEIASEKDPLIEIFIPLLFLAQQAKVNLIQEQFFGELIIEVL